MAIKINKSIVPGVVASARARGLVNDDSSPTVAVYQISRYWRELFRKATRHPSDTLPQWSEKEISAAKIITSALLFLHMEGCRDVEQLLTDTVKADEEEQHGTRD